VSQPPALAGGSSRQAANQQQAMSGVGRTRRSSRHEASVALVAVATEKHATQRGTSRATPQRHVRENPERRSHDEGVARATRCRCIARPTRFARHAQRKRSSNVSSSEQRRSNAYASLKQRAFDRASRFIDTRFDRIATRDLHTPM